MIPLTHMKYHSSACFAPSHRNLDSKFVLKRKSINFNYTFVQNTPALLYTPSYRRYVVRNPKQTVLLNESFHTSALLQYFKNSCSWISWWLDRLSREATRAYFCCIAHSPARFGKNSYSLKAREQSMSAERSGDFVENMNSYQFETWIERH